MGEVPSSKGCDPKDGCVCSGRVIMFKCVNATMVHPGQIPHRIVQVTGRTPVLQNTGIPCGIKNKVKELFGPLLM